MDNQSAKIVHLVLAFSELFGVFVVMMQSSFLRVFKRFRALLRLFYAAAR